MEEKKTRHEEPSAVEPRSVRELVIRRQRAEGVMLLTLQGSFYKAYDEAAFAIHSLTGYKVFGSDGGGDDGTGRYYWLGFPQRQIDSVLKKIEDAGGEVTRHDRRGEVFSFSGIRGVVDESAVAPPRQQRKKKSGDDVLEIGAADLGLSHLIDKLAEGYTLVVRLERTGG